MVNFNAYVFARYRTLVVTTLTDLVTQILSRVSNGPVGGPLALPREVLHNN